MGGAIGKHEEVREKRCVGQGWENEDREGKDRDTGRSRSQQKDPLARWEECQESVMCWRLRGVYRGE